MVKLADYLEKQQLDSKKKAWTRRWFVLDGNTLSYFENQKAKNCKGSFVIGKGNISCDVEKLQFEIRTKGYERAFKAKSAQSFRDWVTALYSLMVSGVFGKPITSLKDAPFLYDWFDYLTKHGLQVEGIFRVSGQHGLISELKRRYNFGETIHLDARDEVGTGPDGVHVVADLLKSFFRSLPIKLISAEVVEDVAVIERNASELQPIFTKMLLNVDTTPLVFALVLRQLFDFLHVVAAHSHVNKMTASNLAVCFTPSLCYLPTSQMESADRILKKLAQCIASAITDPQGWLPVPKEHLVAPTRKTSRYVGGRKGSAAGASAGTAADDAPVAAHERKENNATAVDDVNTTKRSDTVAHERDDSDLTMLAKSASAVSLNAGPLTGIEAETFNEHAKAENRRSASREGKGDSNTKETADRRAQADARTMRRKLKEAGWESRKARDGRTFFFHRTERRSSWSADGLVACWIRVKSSTTGKPYFYHSITKESKWRLGKGDLTFEHIFGIK